MTAAVHNLPRPSSGGRPPLVPSNVVLKDPEYLRFDPALLDSRWYRSCSPSEALAGIALRARSLKQSDHAGSLPDEDGELAYLADFGRDIEAWRAAKAKALEGWILCTDNRWHHPEIARNVLHIWVGRLENRRVSAWGNFKRDPTGGDYGLGSIQDDLVEALAALRAIDPQDAVLGKSTRQWAEWSNRIAKERETLAATSDLEAEAERNEPTRYPNRVPNRIPPEGSPKVRQAKRSQEDSSSPLRGDDSSDPVLTLESEVEGVGSSANRTPDRAGPRPRASPWPPDAAAALRERYPRRDAWGRAEKALERIRKAGKVPIETILAGADRVAARIAAGDLTLEFTPLAATWLGDRGWEDPDPPDPPARGGPPTGSRTDRVRFGTESAVAGIDAVFATRTEPPDQPPGDGP